jgi:hypothetical protein
MTLDQALPIVHEWLGTWRAEWLCQPGDHFCDKMDEDSIRAKDFHSPHPIPMPPASDAMLAQILRRLRSLSKDQFDDEGNVLCTWFGDFMYNGKDPLEAAILACAEWLRSRPS